MMKPRYVVFVHAFKRGVMQAIGQRDEGIRLEQAENPLIQNQPLVETQRGRLRSAGAAAGGWRGGGHGPLILDQSR